MEAVMISIRPKWCELIASGKKTIEVRKTKPKIKMPFKVYIYETKGRTELPTFVDKEGHEVYQGRGQVVGEFVCDEIYSIAYCPYNHGGFVSETDNLSRKSCLTFEEMFEYLSDGYGWGWHISNLIIYEKPKRLGKFGKKGFDCTARLRRPPQSWCYVKENEK